MGDEDFALVLGTLRDAYNKGLPPQDGDSTRVLRGAVEILNQLLKADNDEKITEILEDARGKYALPFPNECDLQTLKTEQIAQIRNFLADGLREELITIAKQMQGAAAGADANDRRQGAGSPVSDGHDPVGEQSVWDDDNKSDSNITFVTALEEPYEDERLVVEGDDMEQQHSKEDDLKQQMEELVSSTKNAFQTIQHHLDSAKQKLAQCKAARDAQPQQSTELTEQAHKKALRDIQLAEAALRIVSTEEAHAARLFAEVDKIQAETTKDLGAEDYKEKIEPLNKACDALRKINSKMLDMQKRTGASAIDTPKKANTLMVIESHTAFLEGFTDTLVRQGEAILSTRNADDSAEDSSAVVASRSNPQKEAVVYQGVALQKGDFICSSLALSHAPDKSATLIQDHTGKVTNTTPADTINKMTPAEKAKVAIKQAHMMLSNYDESKGKFIIKRAKDRDLANCVYAALLELGVKNNQIESWVVDCPPKGMDLNKRAVREVFVNGYITERLAQPTVLSSAKEAVDAHIERQKAMQREMRAVGRPAAGDVAQPEAGIVEGEVIASPPRRP